MHVYATQVPRVFLPEVVWVNELATEELVLVLVGSIYPKSGVSDFSMNLVLKQIAKDLLGDGYFPD